jgi:hypothetical protein
MQARLFWLNCVQGELLRSIQLVVTHIDCPCDYAAFRGNPPSAALGYPFVTSLLDISLAVKSKNSHISDRAV